MSSERLLPSPPGGSGDQQPDQRAPPRPPLLQTAAARGPPRSPLTPAHWAWAAARWGSGQREAVGERFGAPAARLSRATSLSPVRAHGVVCEGGGARLRWFQARPRARAMAPMLRTARLLRHPPLSSRARACPGVLWWAVRWSLHPQASRASSSTMSGEGVDADGVGKRKRGADEPSERTADSFGTRSGACRVTPAARCAPAASSALACQHSA